MRRRIVTAAILLALAGLTPFPALIFSGQEHLLQILLACLLLRAGAKALGARRSNSDQAFGDRLLPAPPRQAG